MNNSKLALQAVSSSVAAFAYISIVSWVMINGERFFGSAPDDIRRPLLFLTLFVFSAMVTGTLLLGRPIYYFLNGKRQEAVKLVAYTILSMFVLVVLAFVLLATA
ncbi:MAG: hypothetical protein AAB490_06100 [Patescibacteria group bacterium]